VILTEELESPENPPIEPNPGSLAWLELKPTVLVDGWELPEGHRVPAGATIRQGEDDGRCRVLVDGVACRAIRTKKYGVCLVHAGGGGFGDPKAAGARGNAVRLQLRESRRLLAVGTKRGADPRHIARVHAVARALDVATALVDAPLDDPDLGTIERQQAVVRMLGETFPLATATVSVELPTDASEVGSMGWSSMQALAARLDEEHQSD